jgi:hypothetical protein
MPIMMVENMMAMKLVGVGHWAVVAGMGVPLNKLVNI